MDSKSKWNYLLNYLNDCLKKPIKHPEFIGYFFVIIMAVGSIGWIASIVVEKRNPDGFIHSNIFLNMSSYSLAILATGLVDLMFHKEDEVIIKPLNILAIGILLFGIFLFWLSNQVPIVFGYVVSSVEILIAWLIWWVANSRNASLTDDSFFQIQSKKSRNLDKSLEDYDTK